MAAPVFDGLEPLPLLQGSLNYTAELRHVLNSALQRSPNSRRVVAVRMSELVGAEITKPQLDAWTAETKTRWRFPFEYAAAFEAACECNDLQELLAQKRGTRILNATDVIYAELGRIQLQRAELDEQEAVIRGQLGAKR